MRKAAAVLCHDNRSLGTIKATLHHLSIEMHNCRSHQEALRLVMAGECSTLIVDFDLACAAEAVRMAALLPAEQKPTLLAVASRAWPGTGQAFQSGANRILYRPLDAELLRDALKLGKKNVKANRRKSVRFEAKMLVHLELEHGTLSAVSTDIGEHGLAIQSSEAVPVKAGIPIRFALPGTHVTLSGHADVIWAADQGRAGLFFSKLTPVARKHLKQWISRHGGQNKHAMRDLMPPADGHVDFAPAPGEETLTEAQ